MSTGLEQIEEVQKDQEKLMLEMGPYTLINHHGQGDEAESTTLDQIRYKALAFVLRCCRTTDRDKYFTSAILLHTN